MLNSQFNAVFMTKKSMILSFAKKLLPPAIKRKWLTAKLKANFNYDLRRFSKFSGVSRQINTQTKLQAYITKEYHRIEKRLAFKEPRVGFAPDVIQNLLIKLYEYEKKYGLDETAQIALNSIFSYYQFNLDNGLEDKQLHQQIVELRNKIPGSENTAGKGGVINISKNNILKAAKLDLKDFFESRYSIRDFAADEVHISLIEDAVKMAQKTPSVCNRQSSKVYVFSKEEDKKKVLSYQNGNRGFGDKASNVLVVTSNLEHFFSISERNQCWIDGGMFSMSLIYALHSLGLGSCCLNWSVEYEVDCAFKNAVDIDDSESIIMMIAVGHLPENLKVAQSNRKNIREVLFIR
ncbi:MAG: nitroreductase family protein [Rivularia sp. (in: Bacteria)]|nr:nitroreductase family protein [Rivularia sp. MS3]